MSDLLLESFARLLSEFSSPDGVRRAEGNGGDAADIFRVINESGFLDALLPENKGVPGFLWQIWCRCSSLQESTSCPFLRGDDGGACADRRRGYGGTPEAPILSGRQGRMAVCGRKLLH